MPYLMQLQDAGCWTDAATLAARHLKGSDYGRFLLVHDNIIFVHINFSMGPSTTLTD